MRICLFPGTFDPITLGHTDILDRGIELFDKIVIGIGLNSSKAPMFNLEDRIAWIKEIYKNEPKVDVAAYSGLTIDFCKQIGARYILRGIRYVSDFEYEKAIADANRAIAPEIETIFLTPVPKYSAIASTLVRDIYRYGGDVSSFLPAAVLEGIKNLKK
ncbi:Phosphopantetheine adenylyltransferase [Chitinophaga terrae (ex Kim and Jung 2007)]|uniref:Phosphopantetheine adenylyltransferase n=1 Tax=Chitinophaga terrae (ex Kim and Jung 2007) TaxID=408074 RepID=A0A1H3WY74_9BACT|nr:pantetheine-phosphate adenylyltransferase [Chitinophaga terrae (ex Kim and Jung 2007)]MDQ0106995.1 pantetheine-phosphate adenylyltransferase [Chitinophaga terrae (ex Kim and Jung 2007)]GEP90241.1 phosphopantetheine adenylyltransferase [Chitinophaga terrae (ex Kim and Jung 2007)]SDZ92063.1 Phosphopantetheine adenylyltransferase [Chitinophaga terrae (ex Kim and Jung 2007)]